MADKKEREHASPNLGRPCYVYEDGKTKPTFGHVTHEYGEADFPGEQNAQLRAQHAGYIDAMLLPRGELPRVAQGIAPTNYTWVE